MDVGHSIAPSQPGAGSHLSPELGQTYAPARDPHVGASPLPRTHRSLLAVQQLVRSIPVSANTNQVVKEEQ